MARKILINTANLHVGGGVQVAISFLYEYYKAQKFLGNLSIFASKEVNAGLSSVNKNIENNEYHEIDVYGINAIFKSFTSKLKKYNVIFTVFGPHYFFKKSFVSIVGFAQPWIIYPDNECYAMLPLIERYKTRFKYWLQSIFFKKSDVLIVELEHVKERLISVLGIHSERIHVVHNCISSIYHDSSTWMPINLEKFNGDLRLGYLGRNYLHKNTTIFPEIVNVLKENYGINACFYVTFTEKEWSACKPEFRSACINIGPLLVEQCPTFYEAMDAIVFPSLLECFSATPLEAMAMEKPLFASDRVFIRDVCGEHANYFDPLSAASAAQSIAHVFLSHSPISLYAAREHAINFSNPRSRAERYLNLLQSC